MISIPPHRSAVSARPRDGPWAQREAARQRIYGVGRREWRRDSGYLQRTRVEYGFFRTSPCPGVIRSEPNTVQRREAAIQVSHPQLDG